MPSVFVMRNLAKPFAITGQTITYVNNASSVSCALPAGATAGDLLVIVAGHGFIPDLPSGFTAWFQAFPAANRGRVCAKTLDAADISAGSVTVTFAGASFGEVVLVSLSGADVPATALRTSAQQATSFGAAVASASLTTLGSASVGDIGVYVGSTQISAGAGATNTFNRGTLLATRTADARWGAAVAGETLAAGTVSVTYSHSPTGNANWDVLLVIRPA